MKHLIRLLAFLVVLAHGSNCWNIEWGGFSLEKEAATEPQSDQRPLEQSTFTWFWESVKDHTRSWAQWSRWSYPKESNIRRNINHYHGHQVWNVSLTAEQYPLFKHWHEKHPQIVDVWKQGHHSITFRVAPSAMDFVKRFLSTLSQLQPSYSVVVENVQELIDNQVNTVSADSLMFQKDSKLWPAANGFHEKYHTWTEIDAFLDKQHEKFPDTTRLMTVGRTYEGRDIKGLYIGSNSSTAKKLIVFHGGIHAREWIGPATMMYIIDHLLSNQQQDPMVQTMLDTFDWIIIPVLNIDGYIFTHESNRMWRKNRQPNKLPWCIGTDSNRNFAYKWNQGGASSNPCSEAYAGSKPFSSPEAQAIAQFLIDLKHVLVYIDFHAYSQLWMYPFGATCDELPADVDKLDQAGKAAATALEKVHGTSFSVGSICNIIYQASGSSIDWAYSVANVTYSYGVELRDTGRYGFLLPPQQIIPSGEEVLAGVLALVSKVKELEKI